MHESIVLSFLPPTCIGHTVAIRLRDSWAINDPSSISLLYASHHTILVITISCKGQAEGGEMVRNTGGGVEADCLLAVAFQFRLIQGGGGGGENK